MGTVFENGLRVLYVVTAYNRHSGDVITPWLVETLRRLRLVGVEVEVLAPAYRGLSDQTVDGVRVHRFRYAPSRWENLTHEETAPDRLERRPVYLVLVPFYLLAGAQRAWRLARRRRFDVVHVHWPLPHGLFGLAARWASGGPLVCSFHGVELTWVRRRWRPLTPFLRYVIRTADVVTANSTYTAQMVRKVYERPVERIPFGATVEATTAPIARAGKEASSFQLLFVGRLVERKGVPYLLDALARLRSSYDVRLRIVGDGPMRPMLEAQAAGLGVADRVTFCGFISKEELARRFAECDAFVLPAIVDSKGDTEGLGVALIEAMSFGKPAIATAVGGIPDIVRDSETGWLLPPADAPALARAIAAVIAEPERARAMGAAGRAYVESEFSWPVIIDRLASLYGRLTRRSGAGT